MKKYFSAILLSFLLLGCTPNERTIKHNSLKIVNSLQTTLERNTSIFENECIDVQKEFFENFQKDPNKTRPFVKKALSIKKITDSVWQIVDSIKSEDISALRPLLITYTEKILSNIDPKDRKLLQRDSLSEFPALYPVCINTAKNYIRIMENGCMQKLYNRIHSYCGFDTVSAITISKSRKVILGNDYKADIFIGSFRGSMMTYGEYLFIGEYDTLSCKMKGKYEHIMLDKGRYEHSIKTKDPGKFTWGGMDIVENEFFKKCYPFKAEYEVVK